MGGAASRVPRLDDEVVCGVPEANDDNLRDVGAEEVRGASRRITADDGGLTLGVGHLLDAAGDSVDPLCNAKRGSRWRSRAFNDRHMLPSHSSPSAKSTSVPLMRGEPSRLSVARVLWT